MIYNDAEGGMDSISLTAPFEPAAGSPLAGFYGPDSAPKASAGGWEARVPLVKEYSDLAYQQLDLTLGGTYSFTDSLYTTAMVTYSDFSSDEAYVYGDEDGSLYSGYLGLGYRF